MNTQPIKPKTIYTDINQVDDPVLRGTYAAMLRAAKRAREIAIQTNTAIIVIENDRIRRITADELRKEANTI